MKKEFDSKPISNKTFLKTKIKSYGDEATDFLDKEISKVGSNYSCLAAILINFILRKEENYHLQVFSKNVNTSKRRKRVIRRITEELEFSSGDSDESDEEKVKMGSF